MPQGQSTNRLKSKIRSLNRLKQKLEAQGSNSETKGREKEVETELLALKAQLASLEGPPKALSQNKKAKLQHNAAFKRKLYTKLRFFEKKKVKRLLRKARAALADATEAQDDKTIEELRTKVLKLQDDYLYVSDFPLEAPYISLFKELTPENAAKVARIRKRIADQAALKRDLLIHRGLVGRKLFSADKASSGFFEEEREGESDGEKLEELKEKRSEESEEGKLEESEESGH